MPRNKAKKEKVRIEKARIEKEGDKKGRLNAPLYSKYLLSSLDVAHAIISIVEMRQKVFIPEVTLWATNPF